MSTPAILERPAGHSAAAPSTTAANSSATTLSVALAGSGGAGVMTAGNLLLDAAAKAGLYGLMVRTSGPQIRGGEAGALVRLGSRQIEALDDQFDLLLAIDWMGVGRFADEIVLGPHSALVGDPDQGEAPAVFTDTGARYLPLPLKKMLKGIRGAWANMLSLGVAGTLCGLPREALEAALRESWKKPETLEANLQALAAGAEAGLQLRRDWGRPAPAWPQRDTAAKRWLLSGNEAAGMGALRGGIRFVAAYPITPATEVLEWLSPALPKVGGTLLQAEDELASVNMIVGASFGGVPSLTATAGPGLSLMTEGIGLAVAAEVPIVIVDVMRGGPSTGIPAKSEQSDLSMAVGGLHGDAPRLVVAPTSISDCLGTTQWAVHLAEALQAPALVLSDQFLGQSRCIIDRPADLPYVAERLTAPADTPDYLRYRDTESGVSPMAIPGRRGTTYTADGLEHTEKGIPSSQASVHATQMDKRARKLERFDYGAMWADIEGDGELAVITFGSATGPVREAITRGTTQDLSVRLIAMRLLAPARVEAMSAALEGAKRILVIEQNHSAQLYRYLRGHFELPVRPDKYHRPGPLPLRPDEILNVLLSWRNAK
ncbi:2-oxoacid:acceptor oxidoreductase subunit alpha [Ottowia sp.]|uniref:2-oxoacid:acceptor oxidoreductase subunit alpha n=1 Tax=Ottowia sp. TaxID=1898956 RepID=UPI002CAA3ACD|nr:2-oxoacid:acceptor oxidoreductase subunit alpha [Ottowia sp.]HRN75005.1 2-oxoacid:acceptor oxidoreductase subunit alpha [Ottowia sp.]HRQ02109.1 2-oxoacid:acceptor oxidoreductase subunit alpha [Ottowia sp.]